MYLPVRYQGKCRHLRIPGHSMYPVLEIRSRKVTCVRRQNLYAQKGSACLENCDSITFKCANCGRKHMAVIKTCPTFIKEKKIRQIISESNETYRKALTMYVPPSSPSPMRNH